MADIDEVDIGQLIPIRLERWVMEPGAVEGSIDHPRIGQDLQALCLNQFRGRAEMCDLHVCPPLPTRGRCIDLRMQVPPGREDLPILWPE